MQLCNQFGQRYCIIAITLLFSFAYIYKRSQDIAAYFLWLYYYLSTGKIIIYFLKLSTFIAMALRQTKFYGYGIFRGEANPHVMTPENKFNVLQQKAYLAIMFVILPAQMVSGIFLWKVKGYSDYINLLGGIRIIATIHVLFFFFFAVFLVVHCYLATLGHTPFAHFKAMLSGYKEHH